MKTISKMAFLFVLIGLSFACKKNDTIPVDSDMYVDSTMTTVDSINTTIDTVGVNPDTTMMKRDTVVKPMK